MVSKVDHSKAEAILRRIVNEVQNGFKPSSKYLEYIKAIVLGPHKTYRYIFVNALLAKATEAKINPVVLQAGSEMDGAYDARSLCHKVLVKIEREIMGNSLGGSNEPFLNKPARYKELSTTNAVRTGIDSELLEKCIFVLSRIETSIEAYSALSDAIFISMLRSSKRKVEKTINSNSKTNFRISSIVRKILEKSSKGESSVVISAISFDILSDNIGLNLKVEAHPVNQSGSSSKEVSDIDVYEGKKLVFTAEVKDKLYTIDDIDHAARKVLESGFDRLLFLVGPNGNIKSANEFQMIEKWAELGVDIFIVRVIDFFNSQLYFSKKINENNFIKLLNKYLNLTRASDSFVKHVKSCLE